MALAAYGFHNLESIADQRIVDNANIRVVADAIDQSVEEHNRTTQALISLFAQETTEYKVRYKTPSATRLQPLTQNSRARTVQPAGQYDVAFPMLGGQIAWGANFVTKVKMTVEEADRATTTMLEADARWLRDQILSAIFTNVSWVFTDEEHGDLTVQPLANGDAQIYLVANGADQGATAQHYLAQAAAIADATNPFPTIRNLFRRKPETAGGQVVVLVPTNLRSAVENLATFHEEPDPNIAPAASEALLTGRLSQEVPGFVFGYVDGCFVSEWVSLPDSYLIAVSTAGPRPLAQRIHEESELVGFHQEAIREDYPFWEAQWARRCGFGGLNRVAAVIVRIGNGTYAIPTGYQAPIA